MVVCNKCKTTKGAMYYDRKEKVYKCEECFWGNTKIVKKKKKRGE